MKHFGAALLSCSLAAIGGVSDARAETEADAQQKASAFQGSLTLVSDYRDRGITLSDEEPALQAGVDWTHDSGLALGVWSSSLSRDEDAPDAEIDLYASKTVHVSGVDVSVGVTWYLYPDFDDYNFGEAAITLAHDFGPASISAGIDYAWEQDGVGETDNTYLFAKLAAPIGKIATLPLTATAGIGYEDGPFAIEEHKWDWFLGLAVEYSNWNLSAAYTGSDLSDAIGDDSVVVSFGLNF